MERCRGYPSLAVDGVGECVRVAAASDVRVVGVAGTVCCSVVRTAVRWLREIDASALQQNLRTCPARMFETPTAASQARAVAYYAEAVRIFRAYLALREPITPAEAVGGITRGAIS